jgi:outer membrane protein TolC
MLKKNNFFILTLLLLEMTSCCRPNGQGNVEIPSTWQSPIKEGMTLEDPSCFHWWEALNDPILTSFIMDAANRNHDVLIADLQSKNVLLKTMNDVSADIAKNYIEFRGLQIRLKILNESIKAQNEILTLNKDLSNRGFFGVTKENEDQKNFESFLMERSLINFSMEKIIFHLSTLLNYSPELLNKTLCQSQNLPDLTGDNPVGYPADLICHDPSVKEARKQYKTSGTKLALYNYQKTVLDTLERAETALAAFNYERDKIYYLENAKSLKAESHQLAKDLNNRGLKDDRDVLLAYQESLSEENSLIQGKIDLLISYIDLYHTLSCAWEACESQ